MAKTLCVTFGQQFIFINTHTELLMSGELPRTTLHKIIIHSILCRFVMAARVLHQSAFDYRTGFSDVNASLKFPLQSTQKSGKRCWHAEATLHILVRHWPKSLIKSVSIRAYWNSSCTVMQAQDTDLVPLQCWASATDLCRRTSTIYLTNFSHVLSGFCV